MNSTVCNKDECTGCMACVRACPKNAIKIEDSLASYNALIDKNKCIDCNACYNVCQQNSFLDLKEPMIWYQGWAVDENIRLKSASGGFATSIAMNFIKNKGIVFGCEFVNGEFRFKRMETESEVKEMGGSKYVKSNPYDVYHLIKEDLSNQKEVLFIGLPCQVAGVKKYVGKILWDNLYTADLICHGTPSPQLLDKFLMQYGLSLGKLQNIQFREKSIIRTKSGKKYIEQKGIRDKYIIGFLNGLTYTQNCYDCKYAKKERVSDITLGDSWGTNLDIENQKKGISLALCQTVKGKELIKKADVKLFEVDIDKAILNNHQLQNPVTCPNGRMDFFKSLNDEKTFNQEILKFFPKECLKQKLKKILAYIGLDERWRKASHLDYGIMYEEEEK